VKLSPDSAAILVQAYETAFDRLLIVLAAMTIMAVLVVFLGLRRESPPKDETDALTACQEIALGGVR
jgi:hypothetical protein